MTPQIPDYLRLHVEETAAPEIQRTESIGALDRLCESFRIATGWSLRYGSGDAPLQSPEVLWARTLSKETETATHLAVYRSPGKTAHDIQNELLPLCDLIDSMADLIGAFHETQHALVKREAELATAVPLVSYAEDEKHIYQRLEDILRGGAEAIDAQAAGLYLLDDATSQLKLRASYGLPGERFLEPARDLRTAFADLEALTGHAVAIDDVSLLPHWNVPETFSSAVCIPVASASTPLGTLWLFNQKQREYSDKQTHLAEIVAGRLAVELERQILLAEVGSQRNATANDESLRQLHDAPLPIGPIATDAWEVAALNHVGHSPGEQFYDWTMNSDGSLSIVLAENRGGDISAQMALQLLRGALKSTLLHQLSPQEALREVAEVMWTSTTGEHQPSAAVVHLDETEDQIEFCSAGPLGALIVRSDRPTAIAQGAPRLASDPDTLYTSAKHRIGEGEAIVLVSDGLRKATNAAGEQLGEAAIAECVRENMSCDADHLTHLIFELWRDHAENPQQPVSIMVAKRRTP